MGENLPWEKGIKFDFGILGGSFISFLLSSFRVKLDLVGQYPIFGMFLGKLFNQIRVSSFSIIK